MFNAEELFFSLDSKLKEIKEELKTAQAEIIQVKRETAKFLSACRKVGIKIVAIETKHKLIPSSMDFSFGVLGSVFANENYEDRPAIWTACDISGFGGGCGNSGQHSLKSEARLLSGVYKYQKGCWKRISD